MTVDYTPEQIDSFMAQALELADRGAILGEVPVGAIVVYRNQIIGRGFNAPISQNDPSAHAEIQAMRDAAKHLGNYRLVGCDLFVTLEPCVMCAGAIMHARIRHLFYGANDPKTGACGSITNLFLEQRLNHHTEVTGGIQAEQCGKMLSGFFTSRRTQHRAEKNKWAVQCGSPHGALPDLS
ncbi:MAG: tRNA adenosine(34) deaminase TadA [Nitrosomonadales bacterium]|nr:MAG: tRNA adenosine(34) deaminase TadA [Nitrosomonadales bacterium]